MNRCLKLKSIVTDARALAILPVLSAWIPFNGEVQAQMAEWRLNAEPMLRIGSERDTNTTFSFVGPVVRLSTGRVAVVDGGSAEIRFFSASGQFLFKRGRKGQGPGEFASIDAMVLSGDTLAIFDYDQQRLTLLTAAGEFLETSRIQPGLQGPVRLYPLGRLRSGAWLVHPVPVTSMRHNDGLFQDSTRVGVLANAASSPKWFGSYLRATHLAVNPTNAERALSVGIYQLGPRLTWAATGDEVWLGNTSSRDIAVVDKTGRPLRTIRVPWPTEPLDAGALMRLRSAAIQRATTDVARRVAEARYSDKNIPRTGPVYGMLVPLTDGLVMVERFQLEAGPTREFAVLDATGSYVAGLKLPAGFTVKSGSADYLLGSQRDALGVETVHMYRVSR